MHIMLTHNKQHKSTKASIMYNVVWQDGKKKGLLST